MVVRGEKGWGGVWGSTEIEWRNDEGGRKKEIIISKTENVGMQKMHPFNERLGDTCVHCTVKTYIIRK